MARLTIGQASRSSGYSKSTLSRACKEGKISFTREGNTILIEQSELDRIFPAKQDATPRQNVLSNGANNASQPLGTSAEIAALRVELEMTKAALEREREAVAREREIADGLTRQLDTVTRLITDARPQVEADRPRRGFRWPWKS